MLLNCNVPSFTAETQRSQSKRQSLARSSETKLKLVAIENTNGAVPENSPLKYKGEIQNIFTAKSRGWGPTGINVIGL